MDIHNSIKNNSLTYGCFTAACRYNLIWSEIYDLFFILFKSDYPDKAIQTTRGYKPVQMIKS